MAVTTSHSGLLFLNMNHFIFESSIDLLPLPIKVIIHLEDFASGEKTRVMKTSSFISHHMPSPRPAAYSPKEVMIPYDLEDLRACFQSSNHAVSDHLHVYILGILNPDHMYI
ncbi:hypothetical protein Tco_0970974 [Tanacetum coccineum]